MRRFAVLSLFLFLAAFSYGQTTCSQAVASPSVQLISGLTATSFLDTTVVDGTTYGYVVAAYNNLGMFSCSNILTSVVIPATGTHSVSLTWIASTTPGVTYGVFRASAPAPAVSLTATVN
jgi:hypothetical protein